MQFPNFIQIQNTADSVREALETTASGNAAAVPPDTITVWELLMYG